MVTQYLHYVPLINVLAYGFLAVFWSGNSRANLVAKIILLTLTVLNAIQYFR
jgi:hypothetical protein